MNNPGSVLLLKFSSLGDVVHALPLAVTLKQNLAGLRLGWVVEKRFAGLVEGHPAVDEVFVLDRGGDSASRVKNYFSLIGAIRRKKYGIMIDLQGNLKSVPFLLLGGAPSLGFRKGSSRVETASTWFTGFKAGEVAGHIIRRNLAFAEVFGIAAPVLEAGIRIGADGRSRAGALIESAGLSGRKIVLMHPGAAWETKIWPAEHYAELADLAGRRLPSVRVALTAGPGEEKTAEDVRKRCRRPPPVFSGLSLGELVAVIDRCEVFIGSDSGPLHLAAALGKSVIGLYGPTDEVRNGPFAKKSAVLKSTLECAGCWRRRCPAAECMKGITVESVFKKLEGLTENVR